jgi:hypothetical protein
VRVAIEGVGTVARRLAKVVASIATDAGGAGPSTAPHFSCAAQFCQLWYKAAVGDIDREACDPTATIFKDALSEPGKVG